MVKVEGGDTLVNGRGGGGGGHMNATVRLRWREYFPKITVSAISHHFELR